MKVSLEGCCSGSGRVMVGGPGQGLFGRTHVGQAVCAMGVLSPGFSVAAPASCPVALRARIRRCRLPTASPNPCRAT
jgi:hypothetical protein